MASRKVGEEGREATASRQSLPVGASALRGNIDTMFLSGRSQSRTMRLCMACVTDDGRERGPGDLARETRIYPRPLTQGHPG